VASENDLAWWESHLRSCGVDTGEPRTVLGRWTLDVEDPEGQRLALVVDDRTGVEATTWPRSAVPEERQLRGLGPVHVTVPSLRGSEAVWTQVYGLMRTATYEADGREVHVFAMGDRGAHAELHAHVDPSLPAGRQGAGGVHHLALRIRDDEYAAWAARLREAGLPNSGPVDRFWFRSLYARDGNGILIELATDGPGFAVDEAVDALGERLVLPPFLEPHRARIEANLQPINDEI
jgi:glyoxalase family protein